MSQQIINIGISPNDGTGDQLRVSFDKCNQNFTELYEKGAGSATEGLWNFNQTSTDTSTSPATGRFRTNTGNFSTATQLAIHQNTINGIDRSEVIRTQLIGDLIQCQDPANANSWCRYRLTSTPVDNSTWFQINVALEGNGATAPSDNREILFTFTANSGGGGGGGGAPTTAEYLTKSADATLSAERVVTDATAITWDWSTAGQVKAIKAALTGDVTAAADSNATTIANAAVTNAKLANMAAHTYKGNNTGAISASIDVTNTQLTADLNLFTSTLQGLAPPSGGGTANFLRADATWAAPAGGGGGATQVKVQVFTASGSYVPSANLISAVVECVGGGGGGGGTPGSVNYVYSGGGGGAGSYSRKYLTAAQIGASQTITIGALGAGGAAGSNNGATGGDTNFGSFCIGKGGSGGSGYIAGMGAGGLGGIAGTGDITVTGAPGDTGTWTTSTASIGISTKGGSSIFGGGGLAAALSSGGIGQTGGNATLYGSGGGGGIVNNNAGSAAGGNGSAGICIVTEYIGIVPASGGNVPTYQTFTSGSGTYTTPVGVRQIEVTLIGGGGGGGAGSNTGLGGSSGTATTFGAGPLFSAGAGGGGAGPGVSGQPPGVGGTVSGSGTPTWSVVGGGGGPYTVAPGGGNINGGLGGSTTRGGANSSSTNTSVGIAGAANSGAGGGGGGGATYGGSGGGAGATIFAIINSPAATYAFTIGTGGAGGASGGTAGGNGGSGIIVVKEIY